MLMANGSTTGRAAGSAKLPEDREKVVATDDLGPSVLAQDEQVPILGYQVFRAGGVDRCQKLVILRITRDLFDGRGFHDLALAENVEDSRQNRDPRGSETYL